MKKHQELLTASHATDGEEQPKLIQCCRCKNIKNKTEFWKSQKRCKDCLRFYKNKPDQIIKNKERHKAWYKKNKRKAIKISMNWRKKNSEKYKKWHSEYTKKIKERHRNDQLLRNYGIDLSEYDAMLKNQNFKCACCDKEHKEDKKLFVDHCHKFGHVRGLLCNKCNFAIGCMSDNIKTSINILIYLIRSDLAYDSRGEFGYPDNLYAFEKGVISLALKNNII